MFPSEDTLAGDAAAASGTCPWDCLLFSGHPCWVLPLFITHAQMLATWLYVCTYARRAVVTTKANGTRTQMHACQELRWFLQSCDARSLKLLACWSVQPYNGLLLLQRGHPRWVCHPRFARLFTSRTACNCLLHWDAEHGRGPALRQSSEALLLRNAASGMPNPCLLSCHATPVAYLLHSMPLPSRL